MGNLHSFLFFVFAGLTGLCAIAVVVSQNIVRSATWLLFTLGGVSGIFFLIGADFVGATQLLIYVGGTLVLVVFGVMLTAQGPFVTMKAGAAEWAIGLVVGLLFFSVLAVTIVNTVWPAPSDKEEHRMADGEKSNSSTQLGLSLLGFTEVVAEKDLTGVSDPNYAAKKRRPMAYLLPFEIISVHLLVVLLGAAYLARAKRRRGAAES